MIAFCLKSLFPSCGITFFLLPLPYIINNMDKTTKDLNRIKLVLVEKKKTNRWLAEQIGKDEATTSKWCTNTLQPSLEYLLKIADVLDVDLNELVRR